MGYLQNQLRAQAAILADDTLTVADAPTGDIAEAAARAVPQADQADSPKDPNRSESTKPDQAPPAELTAEEKKALADQADLDRRKQEARDFLAANP